MVLGFYGGGGEEIKFFLAGEVLDAGFGLGGGRTGTEFLGIRQCYGTAAAGILRSERRAIVFRDPPFQINRDSRIQRSIRALQDIEVIHSFILLPSFGKTKNLPTYEGSRSYPIKTPYLAWDNCSSYFAITFL